MSGVLIVTGASRGIGAACARMGGRRGYAVCVNYLGSEEAAHAVVRDIEADGGRALAVQADVSRESEVVRLFETADRGLGRVTALVNNAGIPLRAGKLLDCDEAALNRLWAVNITSLFLCAREAVRRMSTARGGAGGAIVNVSSAAARLGGGGSLLHYAASKGAADTFTKGLADEVGTEGIRVNAVRPGLILTDIHATMGIPERVEQLTKFVPMRRPGTAEETAEAILWLLSPAASYVTGTHIDVSGGR